MKKVACLLSVLLAGSCVWAGLEVTDTVFGRTGNSDYVVFSGKLGLPSEGGWEVVGCEPGVDIRDLHLLRECGEGMRAIPGERMRAVEMDKQARRGQYGLMQLRRPCSEYAKEHGGLGPSSLSDLDEQKYRYVVESIERSPWGKVNGVEIEGPFVYLVPDVEFRFDENSNRVAPGNRDVLAVELRPYLDDGRHWVLYTDGSCERVEVDPDLASRHNLEIRPVLLEEEDPPAGGSETAAYRLVIVRKGGTSAPLVLTLGNMLTDGKIEVSWDTSEAVEDVVAAENDLKRARKAAWRPYAVGGDSSIVQVWLASYGDRDGVRAGPMGRRGESASMLGLLGGRAAVRETLQMQVLDLNGGMNEERTIGVDSLAGVQVKSHPYEEMLKGRKSPGLGLAEVVPADRFFVYVGKPSSMLPFLDDGAAFISRLGGSLTSNSIKYDLKTRYLARLGLNEEWLRSLLASGAVSECVLMTPDVFFLDGTDITVVSRLAQPAVMRTLLKLVAVAGLSGEKTVRCILDGGQSVYWAMREDLLFVSTSEAEINAALDLDRKDGEGSLGKTAEFRYMLTQLPPKENTRIYAYFSDPFIRRLVGPEVKIRQLRRLTARAEMEYLASCCLLALMDGHAPPFTVEKLAELGYVKQDCVGRDYTIGEDLAVRSALYGTPAQMAPLSSVPMDNVSRREADAYRRYVENYSRYWRQFFDPIAVRIDDTDDGALEATTFILPLIDSSIYRALRGILVTREGGQDMKAPRISPDPVLMISLNLKDEAWRRIAEGLSEIFMRYAHVNPEVLDDLGPGLSLAIHDGDPVIALGSGDILGAFNADLMAVGGNEMMFVPVLLSVLTRPCTLVVETQDPAGTRQYLRQAASPAFVPSGRRGGWFSSEFYQVGDRDAWVYSMSIGGVIKLRYGLEVQDNFVLVRNIPWSSKDRVTRVDTVALNGARLQAQPAACVLQLPGLHAAAAESSRAAAVRSMGCLYPLVVSGYATLDDAAEKHARLFGFRPVHPGVGEWELKGRDIVSKQYGAVLRRRQPAYEKDERGFGLLNDIENFGISMQFEDTGLRTKIRWKTKTQ